jgi:ubiquinone/menaquinone biosynthesis C-methylase UbiE
LKSNGELIVIDFLKKELPIGPKSSHKYSKEKVVTELKQSGFKNFEVNTDLLEMQYIIRAKK